MTKTIMNNKFNNNIFNSGKSNLDLFNAYSTHSIHEGLGIRGSHANLPGINHARNSKRVAIAVNALRSYIKIQLQQLPDDAVMTLQDFMTTLESLYQRNPKYFVQACKILGNWLKVNIFKKVRSQDNIKQVQWNATVKCPNDLVQVLASFMKLTDPLQRTQYLRMVFSILNLYEVVVTPTAPKLETITARGPEVGSLLSSEEIDFALNALGLDPETVTNQFIFSNQSPVLHSSSSAGPNGQAVWNSHLDARALVKDEKLLNNFEKLSNLLGRKDLLDLLRESSALPNFINASREVLQHSKLHFIFEKGDKTRVIAILDYFTQELLTPFHNTIADILKSINMDGTFDQNKIAEWVRVKTSNVRSGIYSFDLSAATDRLPVLIQVQILKRLIKLDTFALLWSLVLTNRSFSTPFDTEVRYEVGQPMGAKSSFPMLGLTHHIIVQIAAKRAGYTSTFTEYVILGDDIMIADDKVANQYQKLMKDLGLEISPFKSIICNTETFIVPVAEICRRLYADGMELTPLPMKLLCNAVEDNLLFFQLQDKLNERGLIYDLSSWKYFVASLIANPKSFNKIALYSSLPTWLTGLSLQIDLGSEGENNYINWERAGISEEILQQYWIFTVLQEQFKRISTLIQSAEDTFSTISRGIRLGDAVYAGIDDGLEIPVSKFNRATLAEWGILNVPHPARFVMLGEVNRVATLFAQLSSVRGNKLMTSLTHSVVDQLKFSVLEYIKDKDLHSGRIDRQIVEKMYANMQAIAKAENQQLTYTVKLNPLGIVWVLRMTHLGSCVLHRSTSNIPSTLQDAIIKHKRMVSGGSDVFNLFNK